MSAAQFFAGLDWTKGPQLALIDKIGQIQVPEGYQFTGGKGTRTILEAFGNPTDGDELGFLCPTDMGWFVVFEFDEVGYVKDDDRDELDADKLLAAIREGNDRANEMRKEMGHAPLNIVGWEYPPTYNPETKNLEWAIRGESEGYPVVNYNLRILGRRGVMEIQLVVEPEQMAETLPVFRQLVAGYGYQDGQKYAEYKPGDKIAKFGLAALVVGGAAAVGAKLGLFAWLAVVFKKAWKAIVVGVVALGSFVKRLFGGAPKTRELGRGDE